MFDRSSPATGPGKPRRFALTALLALSWSCAFAQEFSALSGVRGAPQLEAARVQLAAARQAAQIARVPWSVNGQVGYNRAELPPSPLDPAAPFTRDGTQASVALSLNPLPFGDSADALAKARLAVERAELAYRQALVGVQAQAVSAAAQLQLAREGLTAARAGQELADRALAAVRVQFERGAVSALDLRSAEASAREAAERARSAVENVALAELRARESWRDAVPGLPLPGEPQARLTPQELRAQLDLRDAQIDAAGAQRNTFPTLQASYTRGEEHGQVGLSLNSRTLAPTVTLGYNSLADKTRPRSTFAFGANIDLSSAALSNLNGAQARVNAAQAALLGAQREAGVQRAGLSTQLAQARRALELRTTARENAQRSLDETREREALGVVSPLETLRAAQQLATATAEEHAARTDLLARLLDLYRFYNAPLLEVNE